jgi:hypothetical protein
MAKVTGPLMSLSASGKYAGTTVFMPIQGKHQVRKLVKGTDRASAAQMKQRDRLRVIAQGINFCQNNTQWQGANTATQKERLIAITPPGMTWHRLLTQAMLGPNGAHFDDIAAWWPTAIGPARVLRTNRAKNLNPPFHRIPKHGAGNKVIGEYEVGFCLAVMEFGLYKLGLGPDPHFIAGIGYVNPPPPPAS